MVRAVAGALVAMLVSGSAIAQSERPPMEIGVGFSVVVAANELILPQPAAADLRLTVPVSPRISLEGRASVAPHGSSRSEPLGYFGFQVKQRIVHDTRGGFHPFFTYGAGGYWYQGHTRFPHPEGPPPTHVGAVFMAGTGLQWQIGSHLAVRTDGQLLMPPGLRFSIDLSIPLGRYKN